MRKWRAARSYFPYARVYAVSVRFPTVSLTFSIKWRLGITFTLKRENGKIKSPAQFLHVNSVQVKIVLGRNVR